MSRQATLDKLWPQIQSEWQDVDANEAGDKLQSLCQLLADEVDVYDWVGFYWTDPKTKEHLILGNYVGEPTDHTRIAYGQGICGQAAATGDVFVVQDVSKETNYLSCSTTVKSEIVVPITRGNEMLGQIDIDSHKLEPFTDEDRDFLEKICALLAEKLPADWPHT